MIARFASAYKAYFTNRDFLVSFGLSIALLVASLFINFYAGVYATESASNSVTDIILSNVPVIHFDGLFLYGPLAFWIIMTFLELRTPERFPFWLKSIALFVLIRSAFITFTHLGPFPSATPVDLTGVMGNFTFGGDLFFSAHTGLPFLTALVFWRQKAIRYFCIACSIFFGAIVLLAHLHYTIDVLSAFFITYSIYKIAEVFFKKDKQMFEHGETA